MSTKISKQKFTELIRTLIRKEIKEQQKECEHPLNEIILERDYYGPDEDSHYTNYFRCDKCGEEIEAEEGE